MKPCPGCGAALLNQAKQCADCDWVQRPPPAEPLHPPAEDTGVGVMLKDLLGFTLSESLPGFLFVLLGASVGWALGGGAGMALGVVLGVVLFAASLFV